RTRGAKRGLRPRERRTGARACFPPGESVPEVRRALPAPYSTRRPYGIRPSCLDRLAKRSAIRSASPRLGLGKLELRQRLAACGSARRELVQLLHGGRAGGGSASGLEPARRQLELLERGNVVVHPRDQPLAVVPDPLAVAALVVERAARGLVLRLDLGIRRTF